MSPYVAGGAAAAGQQLPASLTPGRQALARGRPLHAPLISAQLQSAAVGGGAGPSISQCLGNVPGFKRALGRLPPLLPPPTAAAPPRSGVHMLPMASDPQQKATDLQQKAPQNFLSYPTPSVPASVRPNGALNPRAPLLGTPLGGDAMILECQGGGGLGRADADTASDRHSVIAADQSASQPASLPVRAIHQLQAEHTAGSLGLDAGLPGPEIPQESSECAEAARDATEAADPCRSPSKARGSAAATGGVSVEEGRRSAPEDGTPPQGTDSGLDAAQGKAREGSSMVTPSPKKKANTPLAGEAAGPKRKLPAAGALRARSKALRAQDSVPAGAAAGNAAAAAAQAPPPPPLPRLAAVRARELQSISTMLKSLALPGAAQVIGECLDGFFSP